MVSAEQILYGHLSKIDPYARLNPVNTGINRDSYFENYQGWSGTQYWSAKSASLPEKWKQPGFSLVEELGEYHITRFMEYHPETRYSINNIEQYQQHLMFSIGGGLVEEPHAGSETLSRWRTANRDVYATATHLQAVEALLEQPAGLWMYSPKLPRQLFYNTAEGIQGFVWFTSDLRRRLVRC